MAFKKRNNLWSLRVNPGRKAIYDDPEKLWEACLEYFKYVDDNPLQEAKLVTAGGATEEVALDKMLAMTKQGLCVRIGVSLDTWLLYSKKGHALSDVCEVVNNIIFDQKLTGAAAGLLSNSIIVRELGLADKKDVTSSDGSLTPWSDISCGDE